MAHFRAGVKELGLKTIDGITPICPVIVGETPTAIQMQKALLAEGVFVSGFGYPVVPKGEARLRCQISAGPRDGGSRLRAESAQEGRGEIPRRARDTRDGA